MNNILVISDEAIDTFDRLLKAANLPDATIYSTDKSDPELASKCNIWFGAPVLITPLLEQGIVPEWVQSTWAGVTPFMQSHMPTNYTLSNMRGIFNLLIAEYAVGHIFSHELNVRTHLANQSETQWVPVKPRQVSGKTAGILGVGEIGCEIARLCKSVGLEVWGYTRSSEDCPHVDRYFHGAELGEMAAGVDYLIAIMPDTPASTDLLDKSIFEQMQPHAIIINAGRGTAIVDEDLLWALQNKQIGGAVLDVFREEPLPASHPYWGEPNVLITYHTAAPTIPADAVPVFIENYRKLLAGERLNYIVDFERGY